MVLSYISPTWFYGIDSLIETISLLVAICVGFFSYKAYKFTNEKKYLTFAYAFFIIAASLLIKILANVVIEYQSVRQAIYGVLVVTTYITKRVDYVYSIGLFVHRFLVLLALVLLLVLNLKLKETKILWLFTYFVFITTAFSHYSFYVFHLTSAILLGTITYCYHKYCEKKKSKTANLVKISFLWLFLSQITFTFMALDSNFYVAGEILQLIGYSFLLYTFIMVLKK